MERWEYFVETVTKGGVIGLPISYSNDDMQKDLNLRGQEGWELVMMAGGTVGTKHLVQFLWKRKIREAKREVRDRIAL